ncbi:PREDICTED: uncharacterized protein C2orf16 [Dinoponera quadriceps]|uniref:Uncharacterized protein C2orf16 n=1 Tax=Dinoponera quadriceps TaxID=609295 RepID=A0A6P3WZY5_DINQU|nr:PREDICTED: uncharacterized protein C2orf16 [Dinoponera quadriceps]XP_014471666.1 PREDICTED: uncharacterized protein C2orf16 [Dinoponera quadriceps]
MTPMDSDSESQDSDEGRRFRFEATRKEPVAPVDRSGRGKSPRKRPSKHKSSRCDDSRYCHRERKERSKHESRKTDDKDLRHLIGKHAWSGRQEDGKNSHKDHRDASAGSRHSSGDARPRDSKRQSDRSVHRAQRSREHSYERNHEERASSDKRRCTRERHKHRSRERSHQSAKAKPSDWPSREDHGKPDSGRKLSVKENRSQNSRNHSSPKSAARDGPTFLVAAAEDAKKEPSLADAQDCEELDLSQFDVLSETDENTSDGPTDSRCPRLSSRHRDSGGDREPPKKRARTERRAGRKVNARSDDDDDDDEPSTASAASNNNPSAVSDSSLVPAATIPEKTGDARADSARETHREPASTTLARGDAARLGEKDSRHPAVAASGETRSSERVVERSEPQTGPLPTPPEVTSRTTFGQLETSSPRRLERNADGAGDGEGTSRRAIIGPCLPPAVEPRANDRREAVEDEEAAFGPALPPHLLQRMRDNESQDGIIGPVLPDCAKKASPEADSDDECAIGPLPEDHPALRNSRVHQQLDLRARTIKYESCSEQVDVDNKREEWMTELPPAQAANLGLGPRKFRIRDGPDMSDRSCWTDTPAQRAQKQRDSEVRKFSNTEDSDRKRAKERHKKEADKSNKHEKSLLEIHQSKMAKKKKKEEKEAKLSGRSTRRPFDRDIDLQVSRFDQAQKKTVLMKAQMLNDRFSRGQI